MTATIYFFKKFCPRQNMIVVGTEKRKERKKEKEKEAALIQIPLCLYTGCFALWFCHPSHWEMGISFYSLNLDLTRWIALAIRVFTNMAWQVLEKCVHIGTCPLLQLLEVALPEISMRRAQPSLLEDERPYKAETTHLPTRGVSEAFREHQPQANCQWLERPAKQD